MTFSSRRFVCSLVVVISIAVLFPREVHAEKRKPAQASEPPAAESGPQEADVEKIREKYWTRGNENEIGVVQNRLFTKRNKVELGVDLQTVYGDPFLNTRAITGSVGYHFNELYSAHLLFAKTFVGSSSALETLQRQNGTTANTNEPRWYLAGEAHANLLYGKVSLLGQSILHFDAYVSAGAGLISTESGTNPLVLVGIGQLLHINRTVALSLGYKLLWYRETILGKVVGVNGVNGNLGQFLGTRSNLSSLMVVGLSFLLDPMPEEPPKATKAEPVIKP